MSEQREMTLDEWVDLLSEVHLANKQYQQLQQRVQELENTIKQSLDNIEYAAFNLCETVDLASQCIGRVVESTCPETSLFIAIRDMKEVLTLTKERNDG